MSVDMKPTDSRDALIECQKCKKRFDEDDFEVHLRQVHKFATLDQYVQEFPGARVEVLFYENMTKAQLAAHNRKLEDKLNSLRDGSKTVDETFNPSDIKDPDYIKSVFEEHYPAKAAFFEAAKQELIDQGFPPCKAVDDLVLMQVYLRDIHLSNMANPTKDGLFILEKSQVEVLEKISKTSEKFLNNIKEVFDQTRSEKTIAHQLETVLDEANTHIKQNIGEFNFMCPECRVIIDSRGLPHWAHYMAEEPSGKKRFFIWSDPLWELVKGIKSDDKYGDEQVFTMPIWQMAFCLQTSLEGLMYTARQRGMTIDKEIKSGRKICTIDGYEFDIGKEEEKFQAAYEYYKVKYHEKSVRDV